MLPSRQLGHGGSPPAMNHGSLFGSLLESHPCKTGLHINRGLLCVEPTRRVAKVYVSELFSGYISQFTHLGTTSAGSHREEYRRNSHVSYQVD